MEESFLSSPDPLNDLSPFQSQLGSRQATPSRPSSWLVGSSPSKRLFKLNVGSTSHPQNIKVTVETEEVDEENHYETHNHRLSRASSTRQPLVTRHNERTVTTTIPLKGFSEYGKELPVRRQTSKRVQGRPSTTLSTPEFSDDPASIGSPAHGSGHRRRVLGDLVDGDDEEDYDFVLARSLELARGKHQSRSRSVKTSVGRDVKQSPDENSDKSMIVRSATRKSLTRTANAIRDTTCTLPEKSSLERPYVASWSNDAAIGSPDGECPFDTSQTAWPSSSYSAHSLDDTDHEETQEDPFDTILDSEGFSMISIDSVPSIQNRLSSPEVQPKTAATPRSSGRMRLPQAAKLSASMRNTTIAAQEQENTTCITSAAKKHVKNMAGSTAAMQNVDRLLTPEETPPPTSTLAETCGPGPSSQLAESQSSSDYDVSKHSSEGVRSSPPSTMAAWTTATGLVGRQYPDMTQNIATPLAPFSSPKLPPIGHSPRPSQSESALRRSSQNLSPIVRAGRVLQGALISTSNRERFQTHDSPFKSPQLQSIDRNDDIAVPGFSPYLPNDNGTRRKGRALSTVPGRVGNVLDHDTSSSQRPRGSHDISQPSCQNLFSAMAQDDDPFESNTRNSAPRCHEPCHECRAGYRPELPDRIRNTNLLTSQPQILMTSELDEIKSQDRGASTAFVSPSSPEESSSLGRARDGRTLQASLVNQFSSSTKLLRHAKQGEKSPSIHGSKNNPNSLTATPTAPCLQVIANTDEDYYPGEDLWLAEAKNSSSVLSEEPMAEPTSQKKTETPRRSKLVDHQTDNMKSREKPEDEDEHNREIHAASNLYQSSLTNFRMRDRSDNLSSSGKFSDLQNTLSSVRTQNKSNIADPGNIGQRANLDLTQLLGSSPAKLTTLKDQTIESSTLTFFSPTRLYEKTILEDGDSSASLHEMNNDIIHWPDVQKLPTTTSSSRSIDRHASLRNEGALEAHRLAVSGYSQQVEAATADNQDEDVVSENESFCSSQLETSTPFRQQPCLSPSPPKSCLRMSRSSQLSPTKSVIFTGLSPSMSMTPTQSDEHSTEDTLAGDSSHLHEGRDDYAAASSHSEGHENMQRAMPKPSLSKTEWSLDHWKLLQRIWLDAEACPHKTTPAECTSPLFGESFVSTARGGRLLPLEPWHLDVVRWFREEVNGYVQPASVGIADDDMSVIAEGWTEHDIAMRVYGLIVGRERREARAKGKKTQQMKEGPKKSGELPTGIWNILTKNFGW